MFFYLELLMLLKKPLAITIAISLTLAGCASTNTEKGAAIGAIAGAVLGKATANHKDKRIAWGAAIGAIAGAAVGQYMDKQEQEFRDELAGSGIDVVREGDNIRLVMPSNVTFATSQSYISPGFHATLNDIAKVLTKFDKTLLSIEGHTDSSGSNAFNETLSTQRAQSVKDYLVNQLIIAERLKITGHGESQPLVPNDTPKNKALNRRVEIQIIPNKA
jgi:outer membrane protein OmpA-like peptidoglycan-associated protein